MSVRDATVVKALEGATLSKGTAGDGAAVDGEGFSNALLDAIAASERPTAAPAASAADAGPLSRFVNEVDAAQKTADVQVERLAAGKGNVHETAIALEKADIQMRLMMRSRDKVVQAYQEIMRMTV
jgi:flagellar hook-basal body complex protein FliE